MRVRRFAGFIFFIAWFSIKIGILDAFGRGVSKIISSFTLKRLE